MMRRRRMRTRTRRMRRRRQKRRMLIKQLCTIINFHNCFGHVFSVIFVIFVIFGYFQIIVSPYNEGRSSKRKKLKGKKIFRKEAEICEDVITAEAQVVEV